MERLPNETPPTNPDDEDAMSQTPREKLESILEKYCEFPDEFDRHRCANAIIALMKDLVPEEKLGILSHDGQNKIYFTGDLAYNACRQEILTSIQALEK